MEDFARLDFTEGELVSGMMLHERRRAALLAGLTLAVTLGLAAAFALVWKYETAPLLAGLGTIAMLPNKLREAYRTEPKLRDQGQLRYGPDAMEVQFGEVRTSLTWKNIRRWREHTQVFLVYMDEKRRLTVPKRCLGTPEAQGRFRGYLSENSAN